MTRLDELYKLYVGVCLPRDPSKGRDHLWVVGKALHESRLSGLTRSPYSIHMLDRMVYRHYID